MESEIIRETEIQNINDLFNKIVIGGDLFEIDSRKGIISSSNNPVNSLTYYQMDREKDNFIFIQNKNTGFLQPNIPYNIGLQDYQERVKIPLNIAYSGYNNIESYDKFNRQSKSENWGIALLGESYVERMYGKMPAFILTTDIYMFDIEKMELVSINGESKLDVASFKLGNENGSKCLYCNFDFIRGCTLLAEELVSAEKKNIIELKFPTVKEMDPVGAAIIDGKKSYAYLNLNPEFHIQNVQYRNLIEHKIKKSVKLKGRLKK